tara:strand:- start:545 stop:811 length:267 start_codon:yes stop_codon:yes gene_type:complete
LANSFFFDKTQKQIHESFKSIFNKSKDNNGSINRLTKYGWYNTLYLASDGDLKKMKDLEKMPVYDVFAFINYKIDYQKEHFSKNNVKK